MGELLSRSPILIYELSSKCNLECKYCYNFWFTEKHNDIKDFLSPQEFHVLLKNTVDELKQFGYEPICYLSGGEPTINPFFRDITYMLLNKKVPVILISNLHALTDEDIETLVPKLSLIEVTLLSVRPELHDTLTNREGAWSRTVDRLIKIREKTDTPVYLNFVLTSINANEFEDVYLFAVSLALRGVMINRFNPGGRGLKSWRELLPNVNDIRKVLEKAEKLYEEYKLSVHIGVPIPPCVIPIEDYSDISFGFCPLGTPNSYYAIGPDGLLRPCNHLPIVLGDLKEESILNILERQANKLRHMREQIPPICKGCEAWEYCRGGCRAAGYVLNNGVGFALDYNDPLVELFK